jgi:sugar fermentation stimulation protein A
MDLPPLYDGRILRRYKRFLADVDLDDGRRVTAHCPNTGSMRTCWEPGAPVQLVHSDNPKRKLAWTLERVDMGAGWIGVNTHRVNTVIAEAASGGKIPGLEALREVRREVRVDEAAGHPAARLDLLLSGEGALAYVEVKNVTLLEEGRLLFPDAVSVRATRHLQVLQGLADSGRRAVILFALNRPEGRSFSPAEAIDPVYAATLRDVVANGVEVVAVRLHHGPRDIDVAGPVETVL